MPKMNEPIQRITSRGKVRYRVTVDIGNASKRRQTRRTFDTMREARDFYAATKTAVKAGRHIASSKITFDALADEWLAAKELTARPNTVYGYRSGIKPAREAFGAAEVQQITRADIEDLVSAMVGGGKAKRTVEYMLGLLRQVFDRALDEDLIVKNPATRVRPAGKPSARAVAFTMDELAAVRAAIKGHDQEAGFLLTLSGLRRSEVLALRWPDIDLRDGTLSVRHSRVDVGGQRTVMGEPKTERGRRVLPIDPEMLAVLRRARADQQSMYGLAQVRDGFVVVDALGEPMRPEAYSDAWRALLAEHAVRYLDLRAARRSSVTLMRDRGIPDHHVAAWHGHDEAVMRRNYSVAMDDGLRAAGEALMSAFREAL